MWQTEGLVSERLLSPLEAINTQLPPNVPRVEQFNIEEEIENLKKRVEKQEKVV
jgi:hypothetical protein